MRWIRKNRTWTVPLMIAIVTVGVVWATWTIAGAVQSPEQREAGATPPPPGPVFATVTRGDLAKQSFYSGTVKAASESNVTVFADPDASRSVVTRNSLQVGGVINSGDVLLEVNGAPVFAIASPFPFYRELVTDDRGPDVRQLQETLVKRGLLANADGVFGSATESAVAALYRAAGYVAPVREAPAQTPTTSPTATSQQQGESAGAPAPTPAVKRTFFPLPALAAMTGTQGHLTKLAPLGAVVGVAGTVDATIGSADMVVQFAIPSAGIDAVADGAQVLVQASSGDLAGRVVGRELYSGAEGQPGGAQFTVQLSDYRDLTVEAAVRVSITEDLVASDSLLVPSRAVVPRSGDDAVIVAKNADGSLREVEVTVLGSLDGRTAIEPSDAGTLAADDEVRVG